MNKKTTREDLKQLQATAEFIYDRCLPELKTFPRKDLFIAGFIKGHEFMEFHMQPSYRETNDSGFDLMDYVGKDEEN